jgi:hypothetical protein
VNSDLGMTVTLSNPEITVNIDKSESE